MATDIRPQHFIYRMAPASWRPYLMLARVDRPVGTWLLLWPCLWSITLGSKLDAAPSEFIIKIAALFCLGAVLMRAAGCVINDLWDQDIDKQVARTQARPLASGALSRKQALVFLAALLVFSLGILLQMNFLTICLGVSSMALVIAYPVMKRITWWPQLFLGLTFNWGALMGYAAMTGRIDLPAVFLYVGGIFWTLAYDTIYAHQDIEDDIAIGVKSSAIRLGRYNRFAITVFFALAAALLAMASGVSAFHPLVLAGVLHICWQLHTWKEHDAASSLRVFKSNIYLGGIFWLLFLP
jgi:4-hydroxybenzoate polyprenyltransferase